MITDEEIDAAARWMTEHARWIEFDKAVSHLKRERTMVEKRLEAMLAAKKSGMALEQITERYDTDLTVAMRAKDGLAGRPYVSCLGGTVLGFLHGDPYYIVVWPPDRAAKHREEEPLWRSWLEAGCPDDHPLVEK